MQKKYFIDTCALMENENTVEILRNGEENKIYIPITVINELDILNKTADKRYKASKVIKNLWKNRKFINFIGDIEEIYNEDDEILWSIKEHNETDKIFVTNDNLLRLKAYIHGIQSEEFKKSLPFNKESEIYTGIINQNDEKIENCFYEKEGKLFHWHKGEEKCIGYENEAWKIKPNDRYQNIALELLLNKNIDLVTIQSQAGTGKSYLSLAAGAKQVLELKEFKKMIIVKYPVEVGKSLGYLPGSINEKMEPHWNPLYKLLLKLHDKRSLNKFFLNPDYELPELNPRKCEFMPVNYLRGDNIDDAFVIITECQNIPRDDMRTILSRMGKNVNVVCEGDINQIDNPYCSKENNGLNWIIKLMKNHPNYGHITMNCKKTRGIICDMVVSRNL